LLLVALPLLALVQSPPAGDGPPAPALRIASRSPEHPHEIWVPAGTFRMGSTDDELLAALVACQAEPRGHQCAPALFTDERPVREVSLSGHWLDRREVTAGEYAGCVRAGRCARLPENPGAKRFARPDLPVTRVTWEDAQTYCTARGARLPTEAEFEQAMRGPRGLTYPWGEGFASHAVNHGRLAWDPTDADDGFELLAPPGAFPDGRASGGFVDLAGNAAEWVADRYVPEYDPAARVDPVQRAAAGTARVVRGGSYLSAAPFLRAASREAAEPSVRRADLGFRCARGAAADGSR